MSATATAKQFRTMVSPFSSSKNSSLLRRLMAESLNLKRSFSDNSDDDDKPPFHFNFSNFLSPQDAALVTDFLSSRSDGLLRVSSDAEGATAYGSLAALLRIVKQHTVLEIIDSKSSEMLELVRTVRGFSCEGKTSWLDSLEETVRGNCLVDASSVKALDMEESMLDSQIGSERQWLNDWNKMFTNNIENLENRLKHVLERKIRVFEARDELKFKHTF